MAKTKHNLFIFKGRGLRFCIDLDITEQNSVSYRLSKYGIYLPYGNNLTIKDIQYILDAFKSILSL